MTLVWNSGYGEYSGHSGYGCGCKKDDNDLLPLALLALGALAFLLRANISIANNGRRRRSILTPLDFDGALANKNGAFDLEEADETLFEDDANDGSSWFWGIPENFSGLLSNFWNGM